MASLVGHHAADRAPEDTRRSTVVLRTTGLVGVHALVKVVLPEHVVAAESTRDVELLSADTDNTLALKEFLGNNGSKATIDVTLAVNNNKLHCKKSMWNEKNQENKA